MWSKIKEWFLKNKKTLLIMLLGILVWAVIYNSFLNYKADAIEEVNYSEFLKLCKKGEVDTVYYSPSNEYMSFTIFTKESKKMTEEERKEYVYDDEHTKKTLYPAYDEFRKDILSYDVKLKIVDRAKTVNV